MLATITGRNSPDRHLARLERSGHAYRNEKAWPPPGKGPASSRSTLEAELRPVAAEAPVNEEARAGL